MNLNQLEVLVAIVNTGSLTEAAESVGLTQSAVSYSLSKLETELGVILLERGRQGVAVTRIGEEVLQHVRSILTQVEVIRQKTAHKRGLSVGRLRFGCVPDVAGRLLTGVMRDFQHRYPDIDVVLFEGRSQELIAWLENGVIDIGTVLVPNGYASSVHLVQNEIKVIMSNEHPLSNKGEISIEALANQAIIGPKAEYETLRGMFSNRNLPGPHLRHEVSTLSTIFAMVRENMGLSIMPEMLFSRDLEGVVGLSLIPRRFIDVYLVSNIQSPASDAFLANAHDWAKSHGFLPD